MSLGVLVVGIRDVIVSTGVAVRIGQELGSSMHEGRVGHGTSIHIHARRLLEGGREIAVKVVENIAARVIGARTTVATGRTRARSLAARGRGATTGLASAREG